MTGQIYGRHVGSYSGRQVFLTLLAFFGVVLSANGALVFFSLSSFSGLAVENSYVASQTFDKDTAALAHDTAMDVKPMLSDKGGVVTLRLEDYAGAELGVTAVNLTLGHAVSASTDVVLDLRRTGQGSFESTTRLPGRNWQGTLIATLADGRRWTRLVRVDGE
jgi:nitrogen fixation protein FixH